MNKVKTIDKVKFKCDDQVTGRTEPYVTVVDNINAFFCDTSFYYLFKDK